MYIRPNWKNNGSAANPLIISNIPNTIGKNDRIKWGLVQTKMPNNKLIMPMMISIV